MQNEQRKRRIGLVWSAGSHKAPQPERNARVRDVPRQHFFELAQKWIQRHQATLVSMQLEGHDDDYMWSLIEGDCWSNRCNRLIGCRPLRSSPLSTC